MLLNEPVRTMRKRRLVLTAALAGLIGSAAAQAEDEKAIAEVVEDFEKTDGLFPFYTDPETGQVYMEIREDQLGDEFIAFSYAENGVLEAGTFRGDYRDQRIISFAKRYGRLELSEVNTAFYFDADNPLARAKDANITNALLGTLEIVASAEGDAGERYLVDAGPIFKSEMLHQVTPTPNPMSSGFGFQVGGLSSDKTSFGDVRGYPDNVDVIVDYVFENPMPFNRGSAAVTDARSVQLTVQHSIVAMPDDGFEPRFDDYRVGYFADQVTDLTSDEAAPYRDLINRWRLVKKDPEADLSEPVTPITWWIENTTPLEIRDTIKEGVLAWNEAFEKAGFKNAVEVKVQPDDAEWDAGDIRYNVLRWTSSPIPPFGGYGPSFTNPRTGEILAADVMLEYSFITGFAGQADTFDVAGMPALDTSLPGKEEEGTAARPIFERLPKHCSLGHELRDGLGFGLAALQVQDLGADAENELVEQAIKYLVLHEVGHTLGLNHNMKATSVFGAKEIHDKTVTQGAPSGSVMDYHAINIAPLGMEQGDFHHSRPGAYDLWAIEFGYKPEVSDPDVRAALLARSGEAQLAFGNDSDDMRSPGRGIDPRVMLYDQSADPVTYAIDRIELVKDVVGKLLSRYEGEEEASYERLLNQYLTATGQQIRMGIVMSKQVGGVYVNRIAPTVDSERPPYTPVPKREQKRALEALGEYIFASEAFAVPEDLSRHLQRQRRGFNFGYRTEDPKLHGRALSAQNAVLSQLMHPTTMQRLTDTALYGGNYSAAEMLVDLNDEVFGMDLLRVPSTFRQNLQIAYLERLVWMSYSPAYDPVAQAAALLALDDIKGRFGWLPDMFLPAEARAHRAAVRRLIDYAS
ncbi:MAG: zinc-dependent metalloprotease [Parvularcula sp.]|jgi:hypothetical protein|nr:zinc-dependent metalloprotease [Parvularcula sp.]